MVHQESPQSTPSGAFLLTYSIVIYEIFGCTVPKEVSLF